MTFLSWPRLTSALVVSVQLLAAQFLATQSARAQPAPEPSPAPENTPDTAPSEAETDRSSQPELEPQPPSADAQTPSAEPTIAAAEIATAEGEPAEPAVTAATPELEATEPPKKKKKSPFSPSGRIIVRGELAQREAEVLTRDFEFQRTDIDSLDLLLVSARAGLRYRSPIEGVTATLSAEFSRRRSVRNAYVQYKGENLGVRVGQFRVPASPFETDGRRSLPIAHRGFINTLLTDRLEIAGRRPGVSVSVFSEGELTPKFTLGAFQGSYLADEALRETELLSAQALGSPSLLARAELQVAAFEFGLHGTHRVGTNTLPRPGENPDRFWAGGADVKLDTIFESSALRVWLDANVGESWFSESLQGGLATFLSGRLMAAFRVGGIDKGESYVEPFAMVGVLDPDFRVTADLASEIAFGINAGYWRQGRLSLQAETQRTSRNFPNNYALDFFQNRRALMAQMMLEF